MASWSSRYSFAAVPAVFSEDGHIVRPTYMPTNMCELDKYTYKCNGETTQNGNSVYGHVVNGNSVFGNAINGNTVFGHATNGNTIYGTCTNGSVRPPSTDFGQGSGAYWLKRMEIEEMKEREEREEKRVAEQKANERGRDRMVYQSPKHLVEELARRTKQREEEREQEKEEEESMLYDFGLETEEDVKVKVKEEMEEEKAAFNEELNNTGEWVRDGRYLFYRPIAIPQHDANMAGAGSFEDGTAAPSTGSCMDTPASTVADSENGSAMSVSDMHSEGTVGDKHLEDTNNFPDNIPLVEHSTRSNAQAPELEELGQRVTEPSVDDSIPELDQNVEIDSSSEAEFAQTPTSLYLYGELGYWMEKCDKALSAKSLISEIPQPPHEICGDYTCLGGHKRMRSLGVVVCKHDVARVIDDFVEREELSQKGKFAILEHEFYKWGGQDTSNMTDIAAQTVHMIHVIFGKLIIAEA